MACRPEGFDSYIIVDSCESTFGDSDDNIDAITIDSFQEQLNGQEKKSFSNHISPVLENGEESRNRRSRNKRRNNKKKQPQAQSTSNDENVSVQEYPTLNADKPSEFSGHPSQQQMFDPKIFIVSRLRGTTAHTALFKYLKWLTGDDLEHLTFLGEGRAVAEVGKDISGMKNNRRT